MCGRARCTVRHDDIPRACHLNSRPIRHLNMDRYRPSYNVAPGFNVPVVRRDDGGDTNGIVLHCMKWGLIPSFTKKTEKPDYFRMFNARSESIREKASFRRLLPKNRCLVCVEGFYEWKKDGSKKQPYYIHFKDDRPLVFAALYDSWKNSEGEIVYTFTIITTSSSSSLEWLHDRMPVILGNKESTDRWLNDSSLSNLETILKPYEEADLVWYPVTPAVGKLSFDGSECVKEISIKREETKPISQFFSKKEVNIPKQPKPEVTMKEEPIEASDPKIVKEKPLSQSMIETTVMKDEASQLEFVKKEHESKSELNKTNVKDEPGEASELQDIKEEHKNQVDIPMKRDFDEFSANVKLSVKETGKRSKCASDKQPTLFSYFGRS